MGYENESKDALLGKISLLEAEIKKLQTSQDENGLGLFRKLIDHSNEAVYICDPSEGQFIDVNLMATVATGYTREELLNMKVSDLQVILPDSDAWQKHLNNLRQKKQIIIEGTHKRKDGTLFPVEVNISYWEDEGKEYVICFVRNISEREKTGREIEAIFQLNNYMICVADSNGYFCRVNDSWEEILGYTKEELTAKTYMEFIHPEDKEKTESIVKKQLEEGLMVSNFENRYRSKDGTYKWLSWSASCVSESGYIYAIAHDVTELREAQRLIAQNEARLRRIVESDMIAILFWDAQGNISYANNVFLNMFGYTQEDLKAGNLDWKKMTPPEFAQEDENILKEIKATGVVRPFEKEYLHKNGTRIPIVLGATVLEESNDQGIAFILDMSYQKRAESELRASKNRFQQIFDNMLSCVAIYSAVEGGEDFVFKDFNKAGQKVENIDKKDLLGRRITEVFPGVKDFGLFDVLRRVWKTGNAESFPMKEYKDNRMSGWRDNMVYKIESGELVVIYDDVTEKKKMEDKEKELIAERAAANAAKQKALELLNAYQELKDTQMQLIQAEKLAGIGQLSAGIAHELNSPLTGVLSLLRSYKKEKDPEGEEYDDLSEMEKACIHMSNIIKSLNVFARQATDELELVDCNNAIEETLSFSSHHFKGGRLIIEKNYEKNILLIWASKNQIQQVVLNMISNASDAMPEQGTFIITTRNMQRGKEKWVELEFSDSGCGIDEDVVEKIFDPFFTTKRPGGGVGLGLSIVHKIIKNHNGRIKVKSKKGLGSVFTIRLPVGREADNEAN